jgi:hypothetical protein
MQPLIAYHDLDEIAQSSIIALGDFIVPIERLPKHVMADLDVTYHKFVVVGAEDLPSLHLAEEEEKKKKKTFLHAFEILGDLRSNNMLRKIAGEVLRLWKLEDHLDRFVDDPDGLALLANLCNFSAKCKGQGLYAYKPYLVRQAALTHPISWSDKDQGIVYIETILGQVSFHVFKDEDKGLPDARGRKWSKLDYQFTAPLVAAAFMHGWSKYALQQIVRLQEQRGGNAAEQAA